MITPDEIRAVVERPSELPATATADDYLMEKFQRVAVEAIINMAMQRGVCPFPCPAWYPSANDCRACWRKALREGK